MARIQAHSLGVDPPEGWDAQIYRHEPEDLGVVGRTMGAAPETPMPILHLANFALPKRRGDYGGGALDTMGSRGVFVSILQHDPADAATALFKGRRVPWPVTAARFDPNAMPRRIGNQAGYQAFFVAAGRPYCLFLVIGSFALRDALVKVANQGLRTITFS